MTQQTQCGSVFNPRRGEHLGTRYSECIPYARIADFFQKSRKCQGQKVTPKYQQPGLLETAKQPKYYF